MNISPLDPASDANAARNTWQDTNLQLAQARANAVSDHGVTFDALFYRQLQRIVTRIHGAEDLDAVMVEVSSDICKLFNADRLTFYSTTEDGSAIVSRLATGLKHTREIKLPIGRRSIAGYVAQKRCILNIEDVYDTAALQQIDPELHFLQEVDRRLGYRTRETLAAPVLDGKTLHGVLQIINNKSRQPFGPLEVDGIQQLCQALATAIRNRKERERAEQRGRATKYDGLVLDGVITAQELADAIREARERSQTVEAVLLADFHLRPSQIGQSLARFFGVPYEPFDAGRIRSEPLHGALKREFIVAQGWMPLEDSPDGLVVMCLDPEAVRTARVVQQVLPKVTQFTYRVTTQFDFDQTLDQLWGTPTGGGASIGELLADLGPGLEDQETDRHELESAASDNELVKFVNKVIIDAYNQGASDIHIEPQPGKAKTGIRFRIDGLLQPYIEVPAQFRQAIVTRLKIMCDLDISEKRKPQDGKIRFRRFGPLDIELRVATLPSAGGVEDVVMRILAAGEPIPLDKLGLTPLNRERLLKVISKPYGLFYVCGPTGSGKTTTLHSILHHLNRPDTKIWTAEDPVEITQKGLRQVQINKKAGIDFALVMRAFLRADPDIIMVGESRDKETVSMGIEASLTGHLVLSTLHTNSAPESITRLLDMGMDPFNFADALLGVLAQRLARRLCACKERYEPDEEELHQFVLEYAQELNQIPDWQQHPDEQGRQLLETWRQEHGEDGRLFLYRAKGCEKCNQTGYKGRLGLHELLVADPAITRLIVERARVAEIFTAAVLAGMHTLKMDGMEKALMGMTDLKQVRSVCVR